MRISYHRDEVFRHDNRDDIKMNSEKIKVIMKWKKLTYLKKIHAFLSFVNFYKQFIKDFFEVAKFLVKLIRKNHLFSWSKDCQIAFNKLKKRVIEASILSYFSSELETFLKSNSSDYVLRNIPRKNILRVWICAC